MLGGCSWVQRQFLVGEGIRKSLNLHLPLAVLADFRAFSLKKSDAFGCFLKKDPIPKGYLRAISSISL